MKILHISDTHSKHQLLNLPEADILVHSGDFTFAGADDEASDFVNWLGNLPYKHIIFIAGNHDNCMYDVESIIGLPKHIHYLRNSSVMIEGKLFYGVPMFMEDVMNGSYESKFAKIPSDVDVLITHQPPYGILDGGDYHGKPYHYGNKELLNNIIDVKPKIHLSGQDHNEYGISKQNGIIFSNAALLDDQYNLCRDPQVIEL